MNTRRENRLEELGRVDAEKAHTRKGKRNLREEKDRIRSELATGGRPSMPDYKRTGPRRKAGTPDKDRIAPDKRKRLGPKTGGPRPKSRPKQMDTTDYENFMDQYKKHKRDKFRKDLQEKIYPKDRKPGDPPRILEPRLPRPKKDRIMTPLGVKIKYSSGGAVMAGKKVGCQIK